MAIGFKQSRGDINVTPMIDVLLVLLVIFMVVLPERSVGLRVQIPQPPNDPSRALPTHDIVLTVLGGGKVLVDQAQVDLPDLPDRLRDLLLRYSPGVVFIKGQNELDFAQVAEAIDAAKGAGWNRIGLLPR